MAADHLEAVLPIEGDIFLPIGFQVGRNPVRVHHFQPSPKQRGADSSAPNPGVHTEELEVPMGPKGVESNR